MPVTPKVVWLIAAAALVPLACAVSFDGYELAETAGSGADSTASASAGQTTSSQTSTSSASASGTGGGGTATSSIASSSVASSGSGGGSGGAPPSCPTQGGDMVAVAAPGGGYCIDQTEVTEQWYATFLNASPTNVHASCQGNSTFQPANGLDMFSQKPVVGVDWCDAFAFCAFAGKRLCGNIGSGQNPTSSAADPNESQWFRACSGETKIFPYGNLYDEDACNGLEAGQFGPMNVGFFATCQGGYPGIFDMSGNVREWEDSCSGSECMQRSGCWLDSDDPFANNPYTLRCDSAVLVNRMTTSNRTGFRCCADP